MRGSLRPTPLRNVWARVNSPFAHWPEPSLIAQADSDLAGLEPCRASLRPADPGPAALTGSRCGPGRLVHPSRRGSRVALSSSENTQSMGTRSSENTQSMGTHGIAQLAEDPAQPATRPGAGGRRKPPRGPERAHQGRRWLPQPARPCLRCLGDSDAAALGCAALLSTGPMPWPQAVACRSVPPQARLLPPLPRCRCHAAPGGLDSPARRPDRRSSPTPQASRSLPGEARPGWASAHSPAARGPGPWLRPAPHAPPRALGVGSCGARREPASPPMPGRLGLCLQRASGASTLASSALFPLAVLGFPFTGAVALFPLAVLGFPSQALWPCSRSLCFFSCTGTVALFPLAVLGFPFTGAVACVSPPSAGIEVGREKVRGLPSTAESRVEDELGDAQRCTAGCQSSPLCGDEAATDNRRLRAAIIAKINVAESESMPTVMLVRT
jgi:hypothetical protein